jgi:segregation and condensation protein B
VDTTTTGDPVTVTGEATPDEAPPAEDVPDDDPGDGDGDGDGDSAAPEAAAAEPAPDQPTPDQPTPDQPDQPAPAADEAPPIDVDAFPGGARGALEAVLMVVDEPVDEVALATALAVPVDRLRLLIGELVEEYDAASRGFELRRVAGGWRMYSRAEYAPVVERFVLDGQTAKLTQAALETLAIVAYRQPVSRSRVSAVRGVNVDAVMRTLVTRGLVEEAGTDPETGAVLYRTTTSFLHRLGLTSIDDLPALAPYLPEVDALDDPDGGLA